MRPEMQWVRFLVAGMMAHRICIHCKTEFKVNSNTVHSQIFCSDRCRQREKRLFKLKMIPKISLRVCKHCKKQFVSHAGYQKFCDPSCRVAATAAARSAARAAIKSCLFCENLFVGTRRKFCSKECCRAANRVGPDYRRDYYQANRKRILLKHLFWKNQNMDKVRATRKVLIRKNRDAYSILRSLLDQQTCTKLGLVKKIRKTAKPRLILEHLIGRDEANAILAHRT